MSPFATTTATYALVETVSNPDIERVKASEVDVVGLRLDMARADTDDPVAPRRAPFVHAAAV